MPGNFEPEHAFDILSALHRKTPIRLAGQQTEYGTAADLHTRLLRGWIRLPSKFRSSRHPRCNQNRSAVPLGIETHQLPFRKAISNVDYSVLFLIIIDMLWSYRNAKFKLVFFQAQFVYIGNFHGVFGLFYAQQSNLISFRFRYREQQIRPYHHDSECIRSCAYLY